MLNILAHYTVVVLFKNEILKNKHKRKTMIIYEENFLMFPQWTTFSLINQ